MINKVGIRTKIYINELKPRRRKNKEAVFYIINYVQGVSLTEEFLAQVIRCNPKHSLFRYRCFKIEKLY